MRTMEITRNDRSSKVSFPFASPEELVSLKFERGGAEVNYNFGTTLPEASDIPEGGRYVNSDTGFVYKANEQGEPVSVGGHFNPLTNSIVVPYEFVKYCGRFNTVVEYRAFGSIHSNTQQNDVVQPLFNPEELKDFDPDFESVKDADIRRLERMVRAVIERITGQSFELTYGTEIAKSHNGSTLALPKRAVWLEGVRGTIAGSRARVESDGWIVRALQPLSSVSYIGANPIYDVWERPAFELGSVPLTGEWGYYTVPEQIALAAMTLAQDYGCRESVWRDRYITNMKNANWSFEFNDKSFTGTGNVKVDLILQSYTLNSMVII